MSVDWVPILLLLICIVSTAHGEGGQTVITVITNDLAHWDSARCLAERLRQGPFPNVL